MVYYSKKNTAFQEGMCEVPCWPPKRGLHTHQPLSWLRQKKLFSVPSLKTTQQQLTWYCQNYWNAKVFNPRNLNFITPHHSKPPHLCGLPKDTQMKH